MRSGAIVPMSRSDFGSPNGRGEGMRKHISGTFAPIPTPVTAADGRFDPRALDSHLGWLDGKGLNGALILGTNGEFPSFTLAERRQIAEVAASARHRLTLMLGIGSCALAEVLEMCSLAAELGYDAVLCPPPFYFRAAPVQGIADFFTALLDRSPLPVLLYHIPQVTGVAISDELLDRIGPHERLCGVKDSSGSLDELRRLTRIFENRVYMVGSDHLVEECLAAGGAGSISAAASIAPELVAAVEQTPDRQTLLSRVRSLLESYGLGPSVKAILRRRGFGDYATRPPLLGLDEHSGESLLTGLTQLVGPLD